MPIPPIVLDPLSPILNPETSWITKFHESFNLGTVSIIQFFSNIFNSLFSYDMTITANSAITTAAVSLATLFFVMQFFSELAAFRMDRIEEAIRLAMKVIVAKIILENSTAITDMIYDMFWGLSADSFTLSLATLSSNMNELTMPGEPGLFGINHILSFVFIALPSFVITVIMLASIAITIAGIFFEVQIHVAIAPLALSTLVNETTRGTGISFIKSYVATCLQLTIIGLCVQVYTYLNIRITSAVDELDSALSTLLPEYASLVNCVITLLMFICFVTAIKKSGDLTRRMFGV
jgi:hypothetical protein